MEISKNQLNILSNIFSPTIIKELLKFDYSEKLYRILRDTDLLDSVKSKNLKSFFDYSYELLAKNYPNEYVYKNAITNKILLGKHNLNTSFMLNEFRANKSKVDCVVVNGTLTVYEIKTAYDNFKRLDKQLDDYKKVFEKIYVITANKHVDKLDYLRNQGIGIMRYNQNGQISTLFDAQSQFESLDLGIIFDSLRQSEYTKVIKDFYGYLPNVPNTKIYLTCKELFCNIDKSKAYNEVIFHLKQRGNKQALKDFIMKVPKSLKARAINNILSSRERIKFLEILEKDIDHLIQKG